MRRVGRSPRAAGSRRLAQSSYRGHPLPAVHARYLWAVLPAPIQEILPLICPVCGNDLQLITAVTDPEPVRRILLHVGEPTIPPPISPARSPPLWDSVDWN